MNKFIIIVWMCFITAANSQTFTNFTSAVGIEKTELKWSTGTPAVEVHVAVSAAAFLSSVGTVKSVYTSSGGVELVSCVIVISSSTCVIDAAQCNRQIGYDVECSGNTAAFTPILKIASLSETNDNNSVLNFPSSDVVGISSWNFSPLTMTVEDCDKDHFKPSATASRPDSSCGYNCVETLICDVCTGSNFTSQCQATVVWSPETDPCPAGCPVSDFLGRGTSENEALGEFHTCGTVPRFKCNSSLVCGDTYFTPTCGLDAHWSFTNTDDICFKPTCNVTVLQDLCPEDRCSYDDTSTITCGEPFNYTCKSGAEETSLLPVHCIGENKLNYTGNLCEISTTSTKSISTPASASSSTPDAETSQPLCLESCEVTALQELCPADTCSFGNVTEITCGEQFNYTCEHGAEDMAPSPVYCTGEKNKLNYTGVLCEIPTTRSRSTASNFTTASNLVSEQAAKTTQSPCTVCGRLTDASISAICLGIIWVVLDLFLAFFACCTKSDEDVCSLDWLTEVIKKMMKNMPCCKYWTAYWILGSSTSVVIVVVGIIVIVTSTPGDCCGLDEQAIVGIVIAVLGILFIALFLSAVFRVKKKTANVSAVGGQTILSDIPTVKTKFVEERISPRPANSNSEQPEETVELNATSGSKP